MLLPLYGSSFDWLLLILIFVTKLKDLPALVDYEGNIILENPFL